jgi:hypothetical protein
MVLRFVDARRSFSVTAAPQLENILSAQRHGLRDNR